VLYIAKNSYILSELGCKTVLIVAQLSDKEKWGLTTSEFSATGAIFVAEDIVLEQNQGPSHEVIPLLLNHALTVAAQRQTRNFALVPALQLTVTLSLPGERNSRSIVSTAAFQ
jgi:hypothetical protein